METSSELQPDTTRQKEQSQPSILSSQQIQRGAESSETNESSLGPHLPPPKRRGRPPWGPTEEQWEKYRKSRDEAKAREAALAALPEEVKIQRDLDKTSRALLDHLKPEYGRGRWGVKTLLNNGPGLAIQMAPWSPAGSQCRISWCGRGRIMPGQYRFAMKPGMSERYGNPGKT